MVDTGVDQDPFEPSLQGCEHIRMTGLLELMNAFKQFNKSFVHNLFHLFEVILITITYFDSILLEHVV
jgi:hypothetical protein